jgi:hypothetical protein
MEAAGMTALWGRPIANELISTSTNAFDHKDQRSDRRLVKARLKRVAGLFAGKREGVAGV